MDYSLLLGVHYETEGNKEILEKRKEENADNFVPYGNVFQAVSFHQHLHITYFFKMHGGIRGYNRLLRREEFYFMGIIDILQQYNKRKQLGHIFAASLKSLQPSLQSILSKKWEREAVKTFQ